MEEGGVKSQDEEGEEGRGKNEKKEDRQSERNREQELIFIKNNI